MEPIVGIFDSRADAERAIQKLYALGIPNTRIGLLTPGTSEKRVESSIPITDAEPPGIGKAMGATVGGAMGVAGGATMGAAVASLLVPGVGPVIAGGLIGAALLGAGGAATGLAAGGAIEENLSEGLPHDEMFVYEDALRRGKTVLLAFAEESNSAEQAQNALKEAGAASVDAARESWWIGLRDAEAEHHQSKGGDFLQDEVTYRRGFEAALHPRSRGKSFSERQQHLTQSCGDVSTTEAFKRGYDRGQAYHKKMTETRKT
ncbi:MAG TPA: hypothetical protein VIV66_00560 [Pyrinomonadaceae bacterium]